MINNGHHGNVLRDISNETRRIDQLQIEKLKLSQGVDYLRERIKSVEVENRKLLDDLLSTKNLKDQEKKQRQQLLQDLTFQKQSCKKLEELLSNKSASFNSMQKKYSQLQQENTEIKGKLSSMDEKQANLLSKWNNHVNCAAKEKKLKNRVEQLQRQLVILSEKWDEGRVRLQGLEIKLQSSMTENKRLKSLLEEKEHAFKDLRESCYQLESNRLNDETQRKEMLDLLFEMVNNKQLELEQKQQQLEQFQPMMEQLRSQLEILTQKNRHLQQLNTRLVPIDTSTSAKFEQLKKLAEKVTDKQLSDAFIVRLLKVEAQYRQLEELYDKMVVKYYHSVSGSETR